MLKPFFSLLVLWNLIFVTYALSAFADQLHNYTILFGRLGEIIPEFFFFIEKGALCLGTGLDPIYHHAATACGIFASEN